MYFCFQINELHRPILLSNDQTLCPPRDKILAAPLADELPFLYKCKVNHNTCMATMRIRRVLINWQHILKKTWVASTVWMNEWMNLLYHEKRYRRLYRISMRTPSPQKFNLKTPPALTPRALPNIWYRFSRRHARYKSECCITLYCGVSVLLPPPRQTLCDKVGLSVIRSVCL